MSIKEKLWNRIQRKGRGWAFSARDFLPDFKRNDLDTALFHLTREGKIRKLLRGIYDYPQYSELLQEYIPPDVSQIAAAIARSKAREIQPSGNSALNYLRLSTQVPANAIYLWNGPDHDFAVGKTRIHFKRASRRDFSPKLRQSRLLVQAIRALGDNALLPENQARIKQCFSPELWKKIKNDTVSVPDNIYKIIDRISR